MATKTTFVDERTVEVETSTGELIEIQFVDNINYQIEQSFEEHTFTTFLNTIFDKYYDGDPNIVFGKVTQLLLKNNFSMPLSFGLNRNQERERIGNRIKELRKKCNIEAKTLAERVGIDAANLCRIEQGKYSVGFDILSKIAIALNGRLDIVE